MVGRTLSRVGVGATLIVAGVSAAAMPLGAWAQSPDASPVGAVAPGLVDGEPWIAYQTGASQKGGAHGIHLVRPDGSGAFFAGAAIPGGEQLHPEWSPDGRAIVTDVANDGGTYDLWTIDTSDWSATLLVPCADPCLWVSEPDWSPDGTGILFQRRAVTDTGEVSTVEVLDLASGDIAVLHTDADAERGLFAPRWSGDMRAVVIEIPTFPGGELASDELAVLDLGVEPPALRTLVPGDVFANNPDWSADGSLIVFSAPAEGGEAGGALSDLWVIAPDGTGLRQVTDVAASGGSAVHPTFTSDGSRIVFRLTDPTRGVTDVMASVAIDGADLRCETGAVCRYGWHPRLRPAP